MYRYIYICIYIYIYIYTYVYIYIYICMCIYKYAYITYVFIHIYIYLYQKEHICVSVYARIVWLPARSYSWCTGTSAGKPTSTPTMMVAAVVFMVIPFTKMHTSFDITAVNVLLYLFLRRQDMPQTYMMLGSRSLKQPKKSDIKHLLQPR